MMQTIENHVSGYETQTSLTFALIFDNINLWFTLLNVHQTQKVNTNWKKKLNYFQQW